MGANGKVRVGGLCWPTISWLAEVLGETAWTEVGLGGGETRGAVEAMAGPLGEAAGGTAGLSWETSFLRNENIQSRSNKSTKRAQCR